jgi:hypothetical protein
MSFKNQQVFLGQRVQHVVTISFPTLIHDPEQHMLKHGSSACSKPADAKTVITIYSLTWLYQIK